jgi:signal peptidase I
VASSNTRSAARPTRPSSAKTPVKAKKDGMVEWIKSIGSAVLIFLVIRTFLIQGYFIPSESMEPTLLVKDYLMANTTVFGAELPFVKVRLPALRDPRPGEIVVFRPDYNNPVMDVVKRVIGVPGDTLEGREGRVYRNGRVLNEPYAQFTGGGDGVDGPIPLDGTLGGFDPQVRPERYGHKNHIPALLPSVDRTTYAPTRMNWGPLVVPQGRYWLMGDNRDQSLDSRFMGFIPREQIRGKPLFIYYSFDQSSGTWWSRLTAIRWGRMGSLIRTCCQD